MSSQPIQPRIRFVGAIIFCAYALHSFTSLAHEVVWVKLLTVPFGMSLASVAVIIAVFVLGLAFGSFAIAYVGRSWNGTALNRFGYLQAALGAWTLLLPQWVGVLDRAYTAWAPAAESWVHTLLRLAAVIAAILIPSCLIGAVFPLLADFSPQLSREQARGPGRLYLIGLLCSAAGAVIAPLWLLPNWGISASSWAVGLVNLALAATAFGVGRRWVPPITMSANESEQEPSGLARSNLGWVAFVLGFALFGLELIGAKVLWLSVDTTAYAEGILFAVILTAMAVGALLALVLRRLRMPAVSMLGHSLLLAALTQSLMIPLSGRLAFGFSNAVQGTAWVTASVWGFCTAEALLVLMQLGLPVMFGAVAFTSLCEVTVRGRSGFTNLIGRLYAWNNIGAVVGSLATALVLVPWLGMTSSLSVISLLLVVTGAVYLIRCEPGWASQTLGLCAALLISVPIVLWWRSGDITYRDFAAGPQHAVIFHHEDSLGIVEVLESRQDRSRILRSSRLRQEGGTQPQHVRMQRMQGQLPMLLQAEPRRILVVGLGTGISLSGMLWQGATDVSCVEISGGVIRAEPFFRALNGDILGSGKVKLFHHDGREFVKLTPDRYDLIVQDVFFPYQAGVSNLYSVEHYRRCREKLAPGGSMGQWVCINQVGTEDLKTLVRSFASVFPHTTLWNDEIYLLLWGTLDPLTLDLKSVSERIETREATGQLADPGDLLARFVCNEQAVAGWTDGVETNTEDNARIEFQTPLQLSNLNSSTLAGRNLRELQLLKQPANVICRTASPDEEKLLARADQAARLYLSGRIAFAQNNLDAARRDFRASFGLNPSNLMAQEWLVNDVLARAEQTFRSGKREGVMEILEEVRGVAPDDPRILITQAGILAMQKEWPEAADKCRLLLEREPRNTRARALLGNAQLELGELADAEATFRRGLEDAPDDRELQRWLQRCLQRRTQREPGTGTLFNPPNE